MKYPAIFLALLLALGFMSITTASVSAQEPPTEEEVIDTLPECGDVSTTGTNQETNAQVEQGVGTCHESGLLTYDLLWVKYGLPGPLPSELFSSAEGKGQEYAACVVRNITDFLETHAAVNATLGELLIYATSQDHRQPDFCDGSGLDPEGIWAGYCTNWNDGRSADSKPASGVHPTLCNEEYQAIWRDAANTTNGGSGLAGPFPVGDGVIECNYPDTKPGGPCGMTGDSNPQNSGVVQRGECAASEARLNLDTGFFECPEDSTAVVQLETLEPLPLKPPAAGSGGIVDTSRVNVGVLLALLGGAILFGTATAAAWGSKR